MEIITYIDDAIELFQLSKLKQVKNLIFLFVPLSQLNYRSIKDN